MFVKATIDCLETIHTIRKSEDQGRTKVFAKTILTISCKYLAECRGSHRGDVETGLNNSMGNCPLIR